MTQRRRIILAAGIGICLGAAVLVLRTNSPRTPIPLEPWRSPELDREIEALKECLPAQFERIRADPGRLPTKTSAIAVPASDSPATTYPLTEAELHTRDIVCVFQFSHDRLTAEELGYSSRCNTYRRRPTDGDLVRLKDACDAARNYLRQLQTILARARSMALEEAAKEGKLSRLQDIIDSLPTGIVGSLSLLVDKELARRGPGSSREHVAHIVARDHVMRHMNYPALILHQGVDYLASGSQVLEACARYKDLYDFARAEAMTLLLTELIQLGMCDDSTANSMLSSLVSEIADEYR